MREDPPSAPTTGGKHPAGEQSTTGPSIISPTVETPGDDDIPSPPTKRGRRHDPSGMGPAQDASPRPKTDTFAVPMNIPQSSSLPGSGCNSGGMEVDEQISPSSTSNGRISSTSPASSSVPSSSRSSLRARNVSMNQMAPGASAAASPRVDMTQATGRVGMDIDPELQLQHQQRHRQPSNSSTSTNGIGADTDMPASQASTMTDNEEPGRGTHHGPAGAGGKLLKTLGGIFRRHDPAHHQDPPPSSSSSGTQQQQQQQQQNSTSSTNTNGNVNAKLVPPHQSPGRIIRSPLMGALSQNGEPPALAAPVTPRVRSRGETTSEC